MYCKDVNQVEEEKICRYMPSENNNVVQLALEYRHANKYIMMAYNNEQYKNVT